MNRLQRPLLGVMVLAGLLVTAGGAVTMLVPPRRLSTLQTLEPATFGQVDWWLASLLLLAAVACVVVGSGAWFARPMGIFGLLGVWAAAAWLAPELTGSAAVSREVRSLARVLALFETPLLVHLSIRATYAHGPSPRMRRAIVLCYLAVAVAAVGRATTWDPFRVLACMTGCLENDNVLLVRSDIRLSQRFLDAWSVISMLSGGALALWAAASLGRLAARRGSGARAGDGRVLWTVLALGVAMAWWAVARLVSGNASRADPALVAPVVATSLAVMASGVAIGLLLLGEVRRSATLSRLAEVVGPDDTQRSLEWSLRSTLGDPTLRVAYPLDDGGTVDARGEPVIPSTRVGRGITLIDRGGRSVALVEHAGDIDAAVLTREIGAAAQLVVDNERLDATVRARLRELRESRARIVATGDAARSRIERNLHDGAQQRLLAVSYELRLARAATTDPVLARDIDDAIVQLDEVLVELREIAHGIHPAVLTEAGFDSAVRTLAETSPLLIGFEAQDGVRCAPAPEAAAYLAVVEAARRALGAGARRLDVTAHAEEGVLRVDIGYVGPPDAEGWQRVEDRVGAAGGHARISDEMGRLTMRLELPCA